MIAAGLLLLLGAVRAWPRVTMIGGREGVALLRQCSRGTPSATGVWRPDPAQVARAEVAPMATRPRATRRGRRPVIADLADLRRRWRVEATGIVVRGRPGVHRSFMPLGTSFRAPGRAAPTMVRDGDPQLFGAAVDL